MTLQDWLAVLRVWTGSFALCVAVCCFIVAVMVFVSGPEDWRPLKAGVGILGAAALAATCISIVVILDRGLGGES